MRLFAFSLCFSGCVATAQGPLDVGDAGPTDSGAADAGVSDLGVEPDAGGEPDLGTFDAGRERDGGQVRDGGRRDTGVDDVGAIADASTSTVPSIADALSCGRPASAGGLGRGAALLRHDLDLAAFPDARCNDGTAAVIYFRPYNGEAHRNRWVIQLQGGGNCRSPDECAKRWCSVDTNFGMTQMTAALAPSPGTIGDGIFERRADNPIGDDNHVFLRYCSSDNWSGTARDVVVTAAEPQSGAPIEMRLQFLGSRIFDAAIATLRQDGVPALAYRTAEMPDLDDAERVVLAGGSAGGGGVMNNLDRLAETLRATNPEVDVRGLIDSAVGPDVAALDFAPSTLCVEHGVCSHEALLASSTDRWRARGDESCAGWHAAHAPGSERECTNDHALDHHITTPFFVRMGQRDELISRNMIDAQFGYVGAPLDVDGFAALVRARMSAIVTTTPEEARGFTPGTFSPSCTKHETLGSTPDTFEVTILHEGTAYAMFDVIRAWFEGASPANVVSPEGQRDTCP